MTAPTEAEIRAVIAEGVERTGGLVLETDSGVDRILCAFRDSDMARVATGQAEDPDDARPSEDPWDDQFYPPDDHPGTLWANMRPSEVDALHGPLSKIVSDLQKEATAMLVERVVAFAVEFAAEHPDIPRGQWAPRQVVAP